MRRCPRCGGDVLLDGKAPTRIEVPPPCPEYAALRARAEAAESRVAALERAARALLSGMAVNGLDGHPYIQSDIAELAALAAAAKER